MQPSNDAAHALASLQHTDEELHSDLRRLSKDKIRDVQALTELESTVRLISALNGISARDSIIRSQTDGISVRDSIIRSQTERIAQLERQKAAQAQSLSESYGQGTGNGSSAYPVLDAPSFDNMLRYYAEKCPTPVAQFLNGGASISRRLANLLKGH